MGGNPLLQLKKLGQSVWLDTVSREIIDSGYLKRLVKEDGLSGVTSNPTIFHKAISGSRDYDPKIEELVEKGMRDEKELFLSLAIEDIRDASDIMLPVYRDSGGEDGFVSIEVSPDLAYDARATIEEAADIFKTLDRKNIMIKVPATKQGLPAIEELTARGVNVNVTLLFSVVRYREVTDAFMRGLERRLKEGKPVRGIASVASFFVSRVDTLTDKLLSKVPDRDKAQRLSGRAAVANAKMAYRAFREIFEGLRFKALRDQGVSVQRLLWGSTGTKNPAYSDIKYVEEIIGSRTVNTMPISTLDAFRDHGNARESIEDGVEEAKAYFDELRAAGVEIEDVASQLEDEGVKAFADSYFALLKDLGEKAKTFAE